jgi:nucleoside-diphosphate-sugar epimerase
MRIVITGATGLLGRNLLLELCKRQWTADADAEIEILALSRDSATEPLMERLEAIARSEGLDYLGLPADASAAWMAWWRRSVVAVPFDLEREDLGLSADALASLRRDPIDVFIHAAGSTDLRPRADVQSRVHHINLEGTRRMLALLERLVVKRLAHVGSAYAAGMPTGEQPESDFRNPYEESKSHAEALIAAFASTHNLPCTIVRPAALCGRLLERPLGSTCKFDTIYGWAGFFFRERRRLVSGSALGDRRTIEMPVRILASQRAALNIVPVDYAAKTVLDACGSESGFSVLPVVNPQSTPIRQMIGWVFHFLGVSGYQIVQEEPAGKNDLESRYYRSIGRTLAPYMTGESPQFDVSRLEDLERRTGGRCPRIDEASFARLLDHASLRSFGLVG